MTADGYVFNPVAWNMWILYLTTTFMIVGTWISVYLEERKIKNGKMRLSNKRR